MSFVIKHFSELNNLELYHLLQLRSEVFVVEQNCVYQDMDNKDLEAYHVLLYDSKNQLVACSRLLSPGVSYMQYCSIGRVVSHQAHRAKGYGIELMKESIKVCKAIFQNQDIKISAQSYLKKFYTELGFIAVGQEYLEDGIPHIAMIYKVS
ncbi:MAG TPA: GNAT family N-acetyltransferase [Saprospiraceae bacterium]|nr:GNAT family N-acetyltransferase [Saprospiraceae bacterium]